MGVERETGFECDGFYGQTEILHHALEGRPRAGADFVPDRDTMDGPRAKRSIERLLRHEPFQGERIVRIFEGW